MDQGQLFIWLQMAYDSTLQKESYLSECVAQRCVYHLYMCIGEGNGNPLQYLYTYINLLLFTVYLWWCWWYSCLINISFFFLYCHRSACIYTCRKDQNQREVCLEPVMAYKNNNNKKSQICYICCNNQGLCSK